MTDLQLNKARPRVDYWTQYNEKYGRLGLYGQACSDAKPPLPASMRGGSSLVESHGHTPYGATVDRCGAVARSSCIASCRDPAVDVSMASVQQCAVQRCEQLTGSREQTSCVRETRPEPSAAVESSPLNYSHADVRKEEGEIRRKVVVGDGGTASEHVRRGASPEESREVCVSPAVRSQKKDVVKKPSPDNRRRDAPVASAGNPSHRPPRGGSRRSSRSPSHARSGSPPLALSSGLSQGSTSAASPDGPSGSSSSSPPAVGPEDTAVSRSHSMLELGQRANPRSTRRSQSDLGGAAAVVARMPRTSALLSNPVFAKHLRSMMGVGGGSSSELWNVVNERLAFGHDLRAPDTQADCTAAADAVWLAAANDDRSDQPNRDVLACSLDSSRLRKSLSMKDGRGFRIPSFREYKAMRNASRGVGGVGADTIEEEEDCQHAQKTGLRKPSGCCDNDGRCDDATSHRCRPEGGAARDCNKNSEQSVASSVAPDSSSKTRRQNCTEASEGSTATSSITRLDSADSAHHHGNRLPSGEEGNFDVGRERMNRTKESRRRQFQRKRASSNLVVSEERGTHREGSGRREEESDGGTSRVATEREKPRIRETSSNQLDIEDTLVVASSKPQSKRVMEFQDNQASVVRSTSDTQARETHAKTIKKRTRVHKSDPFINDSRTADTVTTADSADDGCVDISGSTSLRACRHGDSLHNTTAPRLTLNTDHSIPDQDGTIQLRKRRVKKHRVKGASSISLQVPGEPRKGRDVRAPMKRVDSGVGSGTEDRLSADHGEEAVCCADCDKAIIDQDLPEGVTQEGAICTKCTRNRVERKEAIQEIVDTEISYGKDLRIIYGEFYSPMKTAGLLNADQLNVVFSNVDELIDVNDHFADILQDALESANEQGDEEYRGVQLGRLFHSAAPMLLAFESYCVQRAAAAPALEQMERDKDLLRIFLSVSQTENSLLRRMSCRAFLMVPVQRLMRYPLLLSRVYGLTPMHNEDRDYLKKAEHRINDIITHINAKTKGSVALLRLSKRKFAFTASQELPDKIEINKIAIELLAWKRNEVTFVLSGQLWCCQPFEQMWAKKGRSLKFQPIHCLLLTLGKAGVDQSSGGSSEGGQLVFAKHTGVRQAALVMIREKSNKYVQMREPIYLDKCVVSVDTEFGDSIEVLDIVNKESYLLKATDAATTSSWHRHLQRQTIGLGRWRQRRNALPNIMMQNLTQPPESTSADDHKLPHSRERLRALSSET